MFTVSRSQEIACPPRRVFAFAGDYENDPRWRTGVHEMVYETSGPPAVGTRTRETMRGFGLTAVTVGEITEYSPGRTAFRSLSGPVGCHGSREFLASPQGTTFTYSLTLRPTGILRVLEPLLRRAISKQVEGDLRRLRQQLEALPGHGAAPAT